MKLASLREGRDGRLIVVSHDGSRYVDAAPVVRTMQQALDDWGHVAPKLASMYEQLESGELTSFMLDPALLDGV